VTISQQIVYLVALSTVGRVGKKTYQRLLNHFGNLETIFDATYSQLTEVPAVGPKTASRILAVDLPEIERATISYKERGIVTLTCDDVNYPANLQALEDAPLVLFARGNYLPPDAKAVAVVGTRLPSVDRAEYTVSLARVFVEYGWTVVSGLALGIDTAAHWGALSSKGRTFAVLGGGVERIYPAENKELASSIVNNGALLSELGPRTSVSPNGLRARNRIITGLSYVVVVVQAQKDSGSLAAGRRALKQNRKVFAVAGDEGCDQLIQEGATELDSDLRSINDFVVVLEAEQSRNNKLT